MKNPTLLILAAGMGSRFGGLKQITPFGQNGETIVDYSLYDAYLAGFKRAVLVIRPDMEQTFREHFSHHVLHAKMEIEYAYQNPLDLPPGFEYPAGRVKPWGTGHAVYAARGKLEGPFGVIGADDFFGRDAFFQLYGFLSGQCVPQSLCMVAYRLENTLSESGSVSRGVCSVRDGLLESVIERTRILRADGGIYYEQDGERHAIDPASAVSLNVWGLHSGLFAQMERDFSDFLRAQDDTLKREYYLPAFIDRLVTTGVAEVCVLRAESRWYGVTHKEDADGLSAALLAMHGQGIYPSLV